MNLDDDEDFGPGQPAHNHWGNQNGPIPPRKFMLSDVFVLVGHVVERLADVASETTGLATTVIRAHANYRRERDTFAGSVTAGIESLEEHHD